MLDRSVIVRANPNLAFSRRVKEVFEGADNKSHRHADRFQPVSQSVVIGTWGGSLIDCYIKHQIGICKYTHAFFVAGELKEGTSRSYFRRPGMTVMLISSAVTMPSIVAILGRRLDPQEASTWSCLCRSIRAHLLRMPSVRLKFHHQLRREFGSVVRLYRFDKAQELVGEWLNVPTGIIKLVLGRSKRKDEVLVIGGWILSCLKNHGSIDALIKRPTEVVQDLAKIERKLRGKGPIGASFDPSGPAAVHVYGNRIGIVFNKPVPGSRKYVSLGVCPFDAVPAPLESLHEPAAYHTSGAVR
jgi:hypothetical protein